ncbi:MAG: hypothetical protein JXR83_18250 [Deltaproteobacteria bacterium]|nr:hypothetical protein [Deltaproteobacteria bacterium]
MGERLEPEQVFMAIRAEVRRLLGRRDIGGPLEDAERAQLAPALRALAEAYSVERAGADALAFSDPRRRAAYLAYYGVRSFLVTRLLAERYRLDGSSVLELGAGPGTAGLGLVARGGGWTAVDVEPLLLELATALGRRLDVAPRVIAAQASARSWGGQTPTAVLLAYTINEWPGDLAERAELLGHAVEHLTPGGLLIAIEPAVRAVSRRLSALRDRLIAGGSGVVGPCTHQRPCPMLERRRDFCHGRHRVVAPPDFVLLGQQAGRFDLEDADFSTLVCGRDATPRLPGWRAVGDVRREKGRDRLFLCGAAGLVEVYALTGRKRVGREALRDLRRGDVLAPDLDLANAPVRIEQPEPLRPVGWLP